MKVDSINRGVSAVVEPGLSELICRGVAAKKLRATTNMVADADISMVCVGTPSKDNGSLCLDYIARAAADLGDFLRTASSYHVVCIRSTVLPGTVANVLIPILERHSQKKAGQGFGVCMNPEFLREGSSIKDYWRPPFTIIGEFDPASGDVVEELYSRLPGSIIRTTLGIAEMVKYVCNSFHALKITFANEIGNICKRLDLDGRAVMEIFCRDAKLNLSSAYLQPGFAFGGSCLPKDLRALLYKAKELDLEPSLLRSILVSNSNQLDEAYRLIKNTGKKRLSILGLSFKAGTDDLRESPIAGLVEILIGKGHDVAIYDREVSLARLHGSNRTYIEHTIPHISRLLKDSIESALDGSDAIIVAKQSPEFEEALERLGGDKCVIDLVSVLSHSSEPKGPHYEGICW